MAEDAGWSVVRSGEKEAYPARKWSLCTSTNKNSHGESGSRAAGGEGRIEKHNETATAGAKPSACSPPPVSLSSATYYIKNKILFCLKKIVQLLFVLFAVSLLSFYVQQFD